MGISLDKKTGINLSKGSSISLQKNEKHLEHVCVGINWGAIGKKLFGFLGVGSTAVDLDGCVAVFDASGKEIDTVYYHQLKSKDGAITHSGDDLSGDSFSDDGKDNEIITLDLSRINPSAQTIVFFLNSYKGQDFASIPYSKIRIFEGSIKEVKEVLATLNLSAEPAFANATAMIMAKLVRKGNGWDFMAIGAPVKSKNLSGAVQIIKEQFLS